MTGPSRSLRVCIVAPSLRMVGGQSAQAATLAGHLNRIGAVEVLFLAVDPALPGPLRTLERIRYVRTLVRSVAYVASLIRILPRCDVVHVFSASYFSYLLAAFPALLIARLAGCRTILNYHSGEAPDHLERWPLSRASMRLAHAIVVPSEYLVNVFRGAGLHATTIPNFVETKALRFRRREAVWPRFFTNRHLEPIYNVQNVLQAFEIVQDRYPNASLVVAGDGSLRDSLRHRVERCNLRHVRFVGRVDTDTMATLYDEADVFVNGSDVDNMPMSILEAFAAGLPVVSTDAGGIPYIVSDDETGLLVPRSNPRALAAAMSRVLSEPGLANRLSAAAYARLTEQYTWPAARDRWLSVYREGPRSDPPVSEIQALKPSASAGGRFTSAGTG